MSLEELEEKAKKIAASRGVWLGRIALLSNGGYWLPNCGGDLNGGGIYLSPEGAEEYLCNWYLVDDDDDYDYDTPLEGLASVGIVVVSRPY